MTFPAYPTYRESGVAWIGAIPPGWKVIPLKHVVSMQSGEQITAERIEDEGDFPVYGGNGLRGYTTDFTHDGHFALIGRQGALCGNINYANGRFWASEHAVVATPRLPCAVRWLGELLRAMDLGQYSVTAAQPGLSVEAVGNLRIPLPPPAEQSAIASFLDRETGKIDALVAEQERLIALLKEKRQAVISQAITKGLDANAPMKDSGVAWLGQVPAHWELRRLKHISPFVTVGIVVNPSSYLADEGYPFIYGGDIREGVIDWLNARRIDKSSSDANSKTRLAAGDLLTVRVGAPGVTAVVPAECEGGNCASIMLIRRGEFNSHWLCYAMNTRIVRYQVEVVQYGAAQEQFNIAHAVNFWAPTPPRAEQDSITKFLDCEAAVIDTLTTEAHRAIALLRERRAALISAAVTGKIDVRGLAAPADAQAA